MSAGSCLDEFMKKFPERCLDVGIAESHAVTFCGGLALGKKFKVVASLYATFLQRALDNVFHDVCLQELPVLFAIDRAGISGPDGATHHGIYDIAFLNAMPNMIIAQPRNGQLLKELLESAFHWGHPAAIRYPNLTTEEGTAPLCYRDPGHGEVLIQGSGLLIISLGHMAVTALQVREQLVEQGIHATVLDPVFIKPLDKELLRNLLRTHRQILTLEEHSVVAGLGAIVNNFLVTEGYLDLQVLNLGIPERFIDQGSHSDLMNDLGLTPSKVTAAVIEYFAPPLDTDIRTGLHTSLKVTL